MHKQILSLIMGLSTFQLLAACSSTPGFDLGRPANPSMLNDNGQYVPGSQCSEAEEGQMRVGYFEPFSTGDVTCSTGIQNCVHGQWQGPLLYEECRSDTKSCDGQPHGSTKTGYLVPSTSAGQTCPEGIVTCLNGKWVGPILYETCKEF